VLQKGLRNRLSVKSSSIIPAFVRLASSRETTHFVKIRMKDANAKLTRLQNLHPSKENSLLLKIFRLPPSFLEDLNCIYGRT